MRNKSGKKLYSHERVLRKTHVTLNIISGKWDMYKIDILEQVTHAMARFETFEDFRATVGIEKEEQSNNEAENWKQVPGFPGYEVSDQGRVRSYLTMGNPSRIAQNPQRILKESGSGRGYLVVNLCKDGKGHTKYIHGLVLLAFVGPKPDGFEVCHYDDNKSNNVLSNLRYDTRKANAADAVRNGKMHGGRVARPTKLVRIYITDDEWVKEIAKREGLTSAQVLHELISAQRRAEELLRGDAHGVLLATPITD